MATQKYTEAQVIAVLRGALLVGTEAGNARVEVLATHSAAQGKMLESCGGSILVLDVDGRTGLGKILAALDEADVSVRKAYGSGFAAHLRYDIKLISPVNGQEWSIQHDADEAAAAFIQEHLGIRAYSRMYSD